MKMLTLDPLPFTITDECNLDVIMCVKGPTLTPLHPRVADIALWSLKLLSSDALILGVCP
jgi:hypothetical protein